MVPALTARLPASHGVNQGATDITDIDANEAPRTAPAMAQATAAESVPLSGYALAVVRWWREILATAVAAAVLGAVGIWLLELFVPRYAASSDVAIIHRGSNVALDDRFQAVARDQERADRRGRQGRRAAMLGLAHQADLAESVFERLQGELEEGASPAQLLTTIDAELVTVGMASNRPESDLIRLTASASAPTLAKMLADAWAELFVDDLNALFADVPQRVVDTVTAELATIRGRYLEAENALQAFMAASRVDLLEQEIAAKDAVIQEVVSTWQLTATAAFQKEMASRLSAIDEDLEHVRKARSTLRDAQGLQMLLDGNSSSVASNSLAIYLLKVRLMTNNPNLEIRLGEIPVLSPADQERDIDITIKSLRQQITDTEANIAAQTKALGSLVGESGADAGVRGLLGAMVRQLDTEREQPMMELIAKLEGEKRGLAAERQDELTRQTDLTLERDLLRTTLSTLQSEVVELQLIVASAPSQARLASGALVPVDTVWPAAPLVGGIFLVVGFVAALLLAPFATALGWQPPLGRRYAPA